MADFPSPLRHDPSATRTDDELTKEAESYYATTPALQLVAELLGELQTRRLPWWTHSTMRGLWGANDRMRWYERRPDLRQQITSKLTGLVAKAARNKTPEFQAELIDSAIDEGDITVDRFDTAYEHSDLVVYGPTAQFWTEFRNHAPWSDASPAHQDLMVTLFRLLLTDKSTVEGVTRKPILTVWELRSSIPSLLWQQHIPIEVRVAIDDARLRQEKARQSFLAVNELAIATPKIICASIPLAELNCVLDAAERAMGLSKVATINTTSSAAPSPSPSTTQQMPTVAVAPAPAASAPAAAAPAPAAAAPVTTPAPAPAAAAPVIAPTLPPRAAEKTGPQPLEPQPSAKAPPAKPAAPPAASASNGKPPAPSQPRSAPPPRPATTTAYDTFEEVTDAHIQPGKR